MLNNEYKQAFIFIIYNASLYEHSQRTTGNAQLTTKKMKTIILGATTNPARYAYLAAHRLSAAGHEIVNIGIKKGELAGVPIVPAQEPLSDVHTVTLYIGPKLQAQYYDYLVKTKPKRIIFNPGTENQELVSLAEANGIEPVFACTLVLLSTGQY